MVGWRLEVMAAATSHGYDGEGEGDSDDNDGGSKGTRVRERRRRATQQRRSDDGAASTRTRTRSKRLAEDRRAHGYVERLRLAWCGSQSGHSVPKVDTTYESYYARRKATEPRCRIALSSPPIVSLVKRSRGTRTDSRVPGLKPAEPITAILKL